MSTALRGITKNGLFYSSNNPENLYADFRGEVCACDGDDITFEFDTSIVAGLVFKAVGIPTFLNEQGVAANSFLVE